MITFVEKKYSEHYNDKNIQQLVDKLEHEKEYNYDVEDYTQVPKDSISISADLSNFEVFFPEAFEFLQFGVDDFIRDMLPFAYTSTTTDGKFTVLTMRTRLNFNQFYKLVKFIIKEGGFCVILKKD